MISVGPSMSTRTASGATPGSAAMIQSCRSVSNTSTGGSQRAASPPRGLEELAVERFRLLEHGAGFGPHLVFRVTHHKHLGKLALDPSAKLIRRNMTRLKKSTAI